MTNCRSRARNVPTSEYVCFLEEGSMLIIEGDTILGLIYLLRNSEPDSVSNSITTLC